MRLWVNKVGPYNNPQETYNYYHLPFCKPNQAVKPAHKWGGLGEVLQGNELIDSQLDLRFRSARAGLTTAFHMAEQLRGKGDAQRGAWSAWQGGN